MSAMTRQDRSVAADGHDVSPARRDREDMLADRTPTGLPTPRHGMGYGAAALGGGLTRIVPLAPTATNRPAPPATPKRWSTVAPWLTSSQTSPSVLCTTVPRAVARAPTPCGQRCLYLDRFPRPLRTSRAKETASTSTSRNRQQSPAGDAHPAIWSLHAVLHRLLRGVGVGAASVNRDGPAMDSRRSSRSIRLRRRACRWT